MEEKDLKQPFEIVDESQKISEVLEQQRQVTSKELERPFTIEEEIDPDERIYLLVYIGEVDGVEEKSFEKITGRDRFYDFVKSFIEPINMNIEESIVITEYTTLKDALSVRAFMQLMKQEYYPDDTFDIGEFIIE